MKGNENVIRQLNILLADELTAINQYIVHAEMCENNGYKKLHDAIKKRAIEEMKHAERLITRILFLGGSPAVGVLNKIRIGGNPVDQFRNDNAAEQEAIKMYNDSIRIAMEAGDHGTAEVLRSILSDEEKHMDWTDTQLYLVDKIGLENYLLEQTE